MFVAPGTLIGQKLSRAAAEQLARNWWVLLLNGAVLVVVGFLIFSIDWTLRELATFIGAVFIFQGIATAVTTGIDARVRRANVVSGLLSIAAGIAIITLSIAGAFAAQPLLPNWWMLLILGLLEIVLSFELKHLPETLDEAWADSASNGGQTQDRPTMPPVPQQG